MIRSGWGSSTLLWVCVSLPSALVFAQGEPTVAPPSPAAAPASSAEPGPISIPPAPEVAPLAPSRAEPPAEQPPIATVAPVIAAPAHHVVRQTSDGERPRLSAAEREQGPWLASLSLGLQAGLVRIDGSSQLRKPAFASLDLGYAPTRRLVLFVRISTWLDYEPFALQFVGMGVSYFLAPDGMFISGVLGMSVLDNHFGLPGDSGEEVQGVAAHLEVGQQWALSPRYAFAVGAHFEAGTPWLRGAATAWDIAAGLFVAVSYR